ncbi:hypothetical protein [Phenylobacterium sp. J367]|uniref:hypothetical protein n=1 Tax=Phenylobacterium sp. J367 TaxID=2898435 RepID=UPI002150EA1E|nr:hypothetical protein [Phenylobacterium sp. J367]MCR5877085.1 hypothetical protein [Phenylobacterium sp. J367]
MTDYRIYVLNQDERVAAELEQAFCNDNAALEKAEDAYAGHYAAEVYDGDRLVARLGAPFDLD